MRILSTLFTIGCASDVHLKNPECDLRFHDLPDISDIEEFQALLPRELKLPCVASDSTGDDETKYNLGFRRIPTDTWTLTHIECGSFADLIFPTISIVTIFETDSTTICKKLMHRYNYLRHFIKALEWDIELPLVPLHIGAYSDPFLDLRLEVYHWSDLVI